MRVTFDTNTINAVARPDKFPKFAEDPNCLKIHQALATGAIQGFFSETMLLLEGVQRADRANVFGSTAIKSTISEEIGEAGSVKFAVNLEVQQPQRVAPTPAFLELVSAALRVGMRITRMPRIGVPRLNDPDGKYLFADDPATLGARQERMFDLGRKIEERDLGIAWVKKLAGDFARRASVDEPWFSSLLRARSDAEIEMVADSIGEWADADNIAAHYGHRFDFFCTHDQGDRAGGKSVMARRHRNWLEKQYGLKFVKIKELAARL